MSAVEIDSQLVQSIREAVARRRNLPESTYRLQLHAGFTFRDATAIVPYLRDLGITHVYASPYLKARPGSTHGYDVIDHGSLNPEIGTQADYGNWLAAMRRHGLGHILDTVPNHVGVGTNDNAWWNDVLENGPASRFAHYFDISWHGSPRPELQ
ncbi:MAG TPA: alpha-amylase family glycosyl hydrolase, partial [Tepidisphaeraceae bacterium]